MPALHGYENRPDRLGVIVWPEDTKLGHTFLVEEIRAGAIESPAVKRLINDWSERYPVIMMLPGNKRRLRMRGKIEWHDVQHGGE